MTAYPHFAILKKYSADNLILGKSFFVARGCAMEYDKDKVDEMTLALLFLVIHGREGEERAWKGFD